MRYQEKQLRSNESRRLSIAIISYSHLLVAARELCLNWQSTDASQRNYLFCGTKLAGTKDG
jgi:hypothetical protein